MTLNKSNKIDLFSPSKKQCPASLVNKGLQGMSKGLLLKVA
jgi:hypothetical protein